MQSTCAFGWSNQTGQAWWSVAGMPAQTTALAARECSKRSAEALHLMTEEASAVGCLVCETINPAVSSITGAAVFAAGGLPMQMCAQLLSAVLNRGGRNLLCFVARPRASPVAPMPCRSLGTVAAAPLRCCIPQTLNPACMAVYRYGGTEATQQSSNLGLPTRWGQHSIISRLRPCCYSAGGAGVRQALNNDHSSLLGEAF